MAMTMGMTAKQNQDGDNDGDSKSWSYDSYLITDILVSIIWRLGVIDFIAFSGVCKSWRTLAVSNKKKFMLSREPMYLSIPYKVIRKKECYFKDLEGRKFKTILPGSRGRTFVGFVSGYLILYRKKTRDFRLVNPITRHELHFPSFPFHVVRDPEILRCALIWSTIMCTWVFMISAKFSSQVFFSLSSKPTKWTRIFSGFPICDLHFFKGKIYTLDTDRRLYELRLNPIPTFTPLKMKNLLKWEARYLMFSSLGEKLFLVDYQQESQYEIVEIDFEQMRWMNPRKVLEEYACFTSILKSGYPKLELWLVPPEQYERSGYFDGRFKDKSKRHHGIPDKWYFPHQCLDVNILHEE